MTVRRGFICRGCGSPLVVTHTTRNPKRVVTRRRVCTTCKTSIITEEREREKKRCYK